MKKLLIILSFVFNSIVTAHATQISPASAPTAASAPVATQPTHISPYTMSSTDSVTIAVLVTLFVVFFLEYEGKKHKKRKKR